MTINLNDLSSTQLGALIQAGKKRLRILSKRAPIAKVRKQLATMAERAGYSIEDLFGTAAVSGAGRKTVKRKGAGARKTGKVAPKYRNPDNPRETWSGRGRMPRWLAARTKHGRAAADFLIPGIAKPTASARKPTGERKLIKKG